MALKRACHLLEKYADATILSGCIRHDVIDKTPKVVDTYEAKIKKEKKDSFEFGIILYADTRVCLSAV